MHHHSDSGDSKVKSPAWKYDWSHARWVHLKTNLKSRPAYIGLVDDEEPVRIFLHFTMIRDGEKWLNYWDWVERKGPLPGVNQFFGCVAVNKGTITEIEEIDEISLPITGRCLTCGSKIQEGKFCSQWCGSVFFEMGYSPELV